jgi:hypothetical protein
LQGKLFMIRSADFMSIGRVIRAQAIMLFVAASLWCGVYPANAAAAASAAVSPAHTAAPAGQAFAVTVMIGHDAAVSSVQFNLTYDPALLDVVSVTAGSATSAWTFLANTAQSGMIKVGAYNPVGLSAGNGQAAAVINFIVKTPLPALKHSDLILSGVQLEGAVLSAGQIISGAFDLAVVNHAPHLGLIGNKSVVAGTGLTFNITGSDTDAGDVLTFAASNLPSGASFDPAVRVFNWTPVAGQASAVPYRVGFLVSDGALSDSQTVDIVVTAKPPVPPPAIDLSIQYPYNGSSIPYTRIPVLYRTSGRVVSMSLDGSAIAVVPSGGYLPRLSNGRHILTITSTDALGNRVTARTVFYIRSFWYMP